METRLYILISTKLRRRTMLKKLLGKYYGNPWLHFAVCVVLPLMVVFYYFKEKAPIVERHPGWKWGDVLLRLIKKPDFYLAVLGAVVGTIVWNALL